MRAQLQGTIFSFMCTNTSGISKNKHSVDANTPCPVQHSLLDGLARLFR